MPVLADRAPENEIERAVPGGNLEGFHYQLIGKIYEAVSTPELWAGVVADLASVLGATRAFLVYHDLAANTGRIRAAQNVDAEYLHAYATEFGAQNPWLLQPSYTNQLGRVLTADAIIPIADLRQTRFYAEFLKPQDLEYTLHAGVAASGDRQCHLIIGRPAAAAPFSAAEVGRCQQLVDHMRRAWILHHAHARQEFVEQGTVEALNLLSVGVAMMGADGKVLAMNTAARAIIENGDGLRVGMGGLEASETGQLVTPAGLTCAAAAGAPGAPLESMSVLAVSRPSGRRPYSLLVCPFTGAADPWDQVQTAALVFISDPERATGDYGAELLRHVYKLTPAEARVATLVAQGQRVLDIAEQLTISVHTARTHLKRIFEKTGVERQAELVQLLYGSLGLLRHDGANGHAETMPVGNWAAKAPSALVQAPV